MAFGRPALTLAGKTLMAKVLAGDTLKFTKMKMGDGSLSGSSPAELNDLINPLADITAENVKKGSNYIAVKGTFSNAELNSGFYWREFGLFAQDKDRGEILFAYANAGDLADYIAAAATSEIVKTLTAVIAAADAENINVTLDTSIVYASAEDLDKITQIVETIIGEKIPDSGSGETVVINSSGVITLTHTYTSPNHAFTGLGNRTGLIPAQFKATAGYTEGDTATIDGETYTIQLTGADAPETDLFVEGKSILVDIDTEGKTINFKSGGGLTGGKLAQATAEEDEVFAGKTFYAKDKKLKTGTALATVSTATAGQILNGFTAYNNNGTLLTGAALSEPITATTDDVNPGMTYYDQNGVLRTGTRKKEVKTEIFQMDGTYTVPAGITEISVRLFGGGGKGSSQGGCGGHMAYKKLTVTPGEKIPVTIGLGGGQSGNSSSTGGVTSFGSYLSASGGSWNSGGTGGGGGSGSYSSNGGAASYGGGGGACGENNGRGCTGGTGGTYGGGGGGASSTTNTNSMVGKGGNGGKYGGKGSDSSSRNYSWTGPKDGTSTIGLGLEFEGQGKAGVTQGTDRYGGAGGGGYGGNGGNGGYGTGSGGGGGGGYGADGGKGSSEWPGGGGGGGGYGGKGGDGYDTYGGGGGGYGKQGNGGSGNAVAGGIAAGGSAGYSYGSFTGGNGGNGICIITYLE